MQIYDPFDLERGLVGTPRRKILEKYALLRRSSEFVSIETGCQHFLVNVAKLGAFTSIYGQYGLTKSFCRRISEKTYHTNYTHSTI